MCACTPVYLACLYFTCRDAREFARRPIVVASEEPERRDFRAIKLRPGLRFLSKKVRTNVHVRFCGKCDRKRRLSYSPVVYLLGVPRVRRAMSVRGPFHPSLFGLRMLPRRCNDDVGDDRAVLIGALAASRRAKRVVGTRAQTKNKATESADPVKNAPRASGDYCTSWAVLEIAGSFISSGVSSVSRACNVSGLVRCCADI